MKLFWQRVDHCAIYLLIAGSYTPFALVTLQGAWGWALLAAAWGAALFGIAPRAAARRAAQAFAGCSTWAWAGWACWPRRR